MNAEFENTLDELGLFEIKILLTFKAYLPKIKNNIPFVCSNSI